MRTHKAEPSLDGAYIKALKEENEISILSAVHRLARLHFEYVPLNLGAKGEGNE